MIILKKSSVALWQESTDLLLTGMEEGAEGNGRDALIKVTGAAVMTGRMSSRRTNESNCAGAPMRSLAAWSLSSAAARTPQSAHNRSVPAQADRMRQWFSHPKSKVDVWSNAGHWIMQDRADDVNAAITAWIGAL
jgi:pimeloyl-ACP methyl ester carboxylesterase